MSHFDPTTWRPPRKAVLSPGWTRARPCRLPMSMPCAKIGCPVVLKAQARALSHDGGVILNIADEAAPAVARGARNDPDRGSIVLGGFGGVQAEVLEAVRLLPPDLVDGEIDLDLVVVYPRGRGAVARAALILAEEAAA